MKKSSRGLMRQLLEGLESFGVALSAEQCVALLEYIEILGRWNQSYNLTAVKTAEEMLPRHLLDSLVLLPHLRGAQALDMGTGAGLPGIPLAIARPDMHWVLADSVGKKIRFLSHVCRQLNLSNVDLRHGRLEQLHADAPFTTITARALADLETLTAWSLPLLADGGRLLALKGELQDGELEQIGPGWQLLDRLPYQLPNLPGKRQVVIIRRQAHKQLEDGQGK